MEVSDCTSVSNCDIDRLDPIDSPASKGLASIPDSIYMPPGAPKPNLLWRGALSLLLGYFHLMTLTIRFFSWLFDAVFGSCPEKTLYWQLHDIASKGDSTEIQQFLAQHGGMPTTSGYFFKEFLSIPEVHLHLSAILQGANICLEGDKGRYCQRWKEHPHCYKRISSHKYQGDECYAIEHIVFWVDREGNTRFQFENSPLKGFLSVIEHTIDYLRYRRDNEQQGVAGISSHTEDFCLSIRVDPNRSI